MSPKKLICKKRDALKTSGFGCILYLSTPVFALLFKCENWIRTWRKYVKILTRAWVRLPSQRNKEIEKQRIVHGEIVKIFLLQQPEKFYGYFPAKELECFMFWWIKACVEERVAVKTTLTFTNNHCMIAEMAFVLDNIGKFIQERKF